jgi:hypothetical protein
VFQSASDGVPPNFPLDNPVEYPLNFKGFHSIKNAVHFLKSARFVATGEHQMQDPLRINQEIIQENALLKQRIQELEKSEAVRKHGGGICNNLNLLDMMIPSILF